MKTCTCIKNIFFPFLFIIIIVGDCLYLYRAYTGIDKLYLSVKLTFDGAKIIINVF